MTIEQKQYGEEKLNKLSKKLNVSEKDLLICLDNIHDLKEFYKWVNASDFIMLKNNKEVLEQ